MTSFLSDVVLYIVSPDQLACVIQTLRVAESTYFMLLHTLICLPHWKGRDHSFVRS